MGLMGTLLVLRCSYSKISKDTYLESEETPHELESNQRASKLFSMDYQDGY